MINEHLPGCDCYDCNHLIGRNVSGLYLYSKKSIYIYKEPGGSLLRTVHPFKVDDKSSPYFGRIGFPTAGKIIGLSNNNRWINTSKGWVFNTNDLYTQTGNMNAFGEVSKLSQKEIDSIVKQSQIAALGAVNPAAALGAQAVEKGKEIGEGVIEMLPKLKWVFIGVIVFLVLILIIKIK